MRKLLFIVLDGAADSLEHRPTPLEAANKPHIDSLAENCLLGVMYPIAPGIAPESDSAVLALLGYNPEEYYTGRGPLEALGVGISIQEGREVAFRANFATVDPKTLEIIDRRVKRSLESSEARELAKAIDGLELLGGLGYARVKATVGHRAVVIIGSKTMELSDAVDNTDPAYERRGRVSIAVENPPKRIKECKPLVRDKRAEFTCSLVNDFTIKAIQILDKHPVNIERSKKGLLKANAILLRDAGCRLPKVKSLKEIYGVEFGAIVEMPVEKGIARLLGMKVYEVGYPTGRPERDLPLRVEATLKAIEECSVVYVHLKGPDEPGHDGDFEGKKRAIENIDRYYFKELLASLSLDRTMILVTSDHATPWTKRTHTSDPVPLMLAGKDLPSGPKRFDEATCLEYSSKGLGVIEHGWELLPRVMKLVMSLE